MFKADYKINKQLESIRSELLQVFLSYLEDSTVSITKHKADLANKAVGCFILNTYYSFLQHKEFGYVSLHSESFSKGVIINGQRSQRKVSYTYFRSLIDCLEYNNYILLQKGGVLSYTFCTGRMEVDSAESSKVVFKTKLKDLYSSVDKVVDPLINIIRLKDKSKQEVTFKMDKNIREVKEIVDSVNRFSLTKVVKCKDKVYDVQQYKVYNENFNKGGRGFMQDSIQSLNKENRKLLTIDDSPVCMFDFKGFEPSIVYCLEQEVMEEDDPYQLVIDGYDPSLLRKLGKLGLLIMLNCESEYQAQLAFDKEVASEYDLHKLYLQGKILSEVIPTKYIMQMLQEKHHLISHKFYNSFGGDVMCVGGMIADYIVSSMMQKHNVLVLQVFDEFLCDIEYADELEACMLSAWDFVLGTKNNCTIVREQ